MWEELLTSAVIIEIIGEFEESEKNNWFTFFFSIINHFMKKKSKYQNICEKLNSDLFG